MSEPRNCHVVGNGMLARAFRVLPEPIRPAYCFFASGVSNSACIDTDAFAREQRLLLASLERYRAVEAIVYFGTCAADVPGNEASAYVNHKLAMEALVLAQPNGRIVRLPQVAGPDASPFTLLSALSSQIRSGRPVTLRKHATRNLIDVADVVRVVDAWLPRSEGTRRVNVANTQSYPIATIVEAIEAVLGLRVPHETLDAGEPYEVDTSAIAPLMASLGVVFDDAYLPRIIAKYYT